jgi:protein-S-isoprenylcysteine O-methyltransferase Ste14
MKQQKKIKIIRWIARIWSILAVLLAFVLLISTLMETGDEPPSTIFWMLFGLWFAAVLSLLISWRWEIVGSVLAITALISREMAVFYLSGEFLVGFWMVWLPVLPPAILFILAWREDRKLKEKQMPREVYD